MILESLVIGSVLYGGYQQNKKQRRLEKRHQARLAQQDPNKIPLTAPKVVEDNGSIGAIVKGSIQDGHEHCDKPKTLTQHVKRAFKSENSRSLIIASSGLVLSATGLFVYTAVGLLSIPFVLYTSRGAHLKALKDLKQGKAGIDTLVSITLLGCLVTGRFFIASLMTVLLRLATRLTSKVTHDSKQELFGSFEQQADFVWVLINSIETKIAFNDLKSGDIVVVHAGELIPADGHITEGMASIDQHILTGEARPVERGEGEEVFASTVMLSGKIYIKVEQMGQDSTVAKITQILNETIEYKSTTQLRAEQLSKKLVKPALIAGGIALPTLGLGSALAVINSHPKNKLMIIAPITIMTYLRQASKQGLLIKDGRSLELLRQVDTLIFDKTGTLTEEQPHVGNIHLCADQDEDTVLAYAAAAEYKQKHPLALAIIGAAHKRNLSLEPIEDSAYKVGYGLSVHIGGQLIRVGSDRFMQSENIAIPADISQAQTACEHEGYTLVMIACNDQLIGAIELLPTIRAEAKAVIKALKSRAQIKHTYIISGDNEIPTKKMAAELGIDGYFAETLPENKANLIKKLQVEGHFICYVGDGINDSIALKQAQVSVSLHGASAIATDTAQIVLMDQGLSHLNTLFDIAERFNENMDRSFRIMLTPAILGAGGAFLLGFGLPQTVFLNMSSLFVGLANAALMPMLSKSKTKPLVLDHKNKKAA